MQQHGIEAMFEDMLAKLALHQPADPRAFLCEELQRATPGLATEENLSVLFDRLAAGEPTITAHAARAALEAFGLGFVQSSSVVDKKAFVGVLSSQ